MKAMARHSGAAQSLIEDDSLQLMFHMVAMGVPTRKEVVSEVADIDSTSPLHLAQLHRHVMQVFFFSIWALLIISFCHCLGESILVSKHLWPDLLLPSRQTKG